MHFSGYQMLPHFSGIQQVKNSPILALRKITHMIWQNKITTKKNNKITTLIFSIS